MKILYLHQYFITPGMSGGTRSFEMARRMVQAGHEVHMVTSRFDGEFTGNRWVMEEIEGIRVHWFPVRYSNSLGIVSRLVAFFRFAFAASVFASRIKADVVFATSTPLTIAIPAVVAKWRQRVPMVFEVRDLWPELPIAMGALNFPLAKTLARWLERWAYHHSARVVGLSPGMCEGVIETGFPEQHTVCIPNSCDNDRFTANPLAAEEFRNQRGWLGDRKLVVYVGTFGKINGVSYLAEIAAEMMKIDPEVRFLVVGDGAERELVEARAASLGVLNTNFFMEAPVPKEQVPVILTAATVCSSLFISLPAMWNNSANKFFDALAAGKPVMINYGGWQKDLLEEHSAGVCLPSEEPGKAAHLLSALLSDEQRLKEAGSASRTLALEHFSRDDLAATLIRTLEEVSGGRDD